MAHVEKGHGFGRLDPFISSSTVPMIQLPDPAGKADDEAINKVASSSASSHAEANSCKRTTPQSQCSRSGIPGNIHQISNTAPNSSFPTTAFCKSASQMGVRTSNMILEVGARGDRGCFSARLHYSAKRLCASSRLPYPFKGLWPATPVKHQPPIIYRPENASLVFK
jgi:hypothetical protein